MDEQQGPDEVPGTQNPIMVALLAVALTGFIAYSLMYGQWSCSMHGGTSTQDVLRMSRKPAVQDQPASIEYNGRDLLHPKPASNHSAQ